jgi:hypothetical protein
MSCYVPFYFCICLATPVSVIIFTIGAFRAKQRTTTRLMCEILQNAKLPKAGEISTLSPLYRATWTPSAPGQSHRKGTKSLLPFLFFRIKHF